MKFAAYDYGEHASKVISGWNKQFSSDIPKLDDIDGEIGQDVMLDAIKGKACQPLDLSQSCNGSNAFHLSGKSDPINNCKNESNCSATPCPCATSEISLIAQEDLFYMDKTVTDIELPHLSISTKTATVKDICIDDGMQMFEKIWVEYDKVDHAVISSSHFPRGKCDSSLMVKTTENDNSGDLKHLSTNEGLGSFGKILDSNVRDEEFSNPKRATYLNETTDKTGKNDLRAFIATGHPYEQCYSSSSISERPLDTTKITACALHSKEIIDQRPHLFEQFNSNSSRADLSSHNDCTTEIQDLRREIDQVAEEEDLRTMTASSPEKTKESFQIPGKVSSNKDLFEEDKTSESFDTSNDTNGTSDEHKFDGVASISKLEAGDKSMVGNENEVLNNQQIVQSQNSVETVEAAGDDTTSARSSLSHLNHEDSNLLGPAIFSSSITTSSHIPYSGNISYRSESSTTSGQSFAFPILQPEWNSSPVRMSKADRRHLRKHRWKSVLTCCNF